MIKVDIWTEGIADQKFIVDILKKGFEFDFPLPKKGTREIVFDYESDAYKIRVLALGSVSAVTTLNGWEKKKNDFKDNTLTGIKNLVIIDTDDSFEQQKQKVKDTLVDVGFDIDSDIYLWPDNQPHASKSDLESLLIQLVHEDHTGVLSCFEKYEECLNQQQKGYNTPDTKAKIYSYAQTITGDGNERYRDYTNDLHWNLDFTQPPLKQFYEFLKIHLDK